MDSLAAALEERWVPALIASWRRACRTRGPAGELLASEVKQVAAGVRRLSLGLTRERSLIGARYMEDPELLGAYLLFYWPISYAQGRSVLSELAAPPGRVLDLGSGPGPLTFAAYDRGARELIAADRSNPALTMARSIAEQAGLRGLVTQRWDGLQGGELPAGRFDLIALGHVLNELWAGHEAAGPNRADLLERLLGILTPGGSLMILEPALRETSRGLLEVRDLLVERGFTIRAPCLVGGSCPALEKAGDWCHADRPWTAPPLVREIGELAKIHKNSLKMSYLLVGPKEEAGPVAEPRPGLFRIVSEPLPSKGRLRYMGCGPKGRLGLSLQTRLLGPANEAFASLRRGDVVEVEGTGERGDGLALEEGGAVRLVAKAGEALPIG